MFFSKASDLKVRLGEHDVTSILEPTEHEERDVAEVKIYPQFEKKTLINDIALVKLQLPAKRRANIDIVCIPSDQLHIPDNKTCYVTGWGRQSESMLN